MDDIDIMPNDSLSQFSAMTSGQEIDESTGTHGTAQTSGGNILEHVDETDKIDQQTFFFSRLKTVFEVSDECTVEKARKFLKVYIKICIVADSSHNTLISSRDFNDRREHRLHGRISLKEFIILLVNHMRFASPVTAI